MGTTQSFPTTILEHPMDPAFPKTILDLPTDVLFEIFVRLPHLKDVLACGRACRLFRQIIQSSTQLEYQIELEKAGMINNPRCKLTTSRRLKMLREREASWGGFNWKLRVPNVFIPSVLAPAEIHIVTSISVMLGFADENSEPGMRPGFKTTGFQAVTLPSGEDKDTSLGKVVDVGEEIFKFGTAAEEHDLLAYITL